MDEKVNCPLCASPASEVSVPRFDSTQIECANCGTFRMTRTLRESLRPYGARELAKLSHVVRTMQSRSEVTQLNTALAESIVKNQRLPSAAEQFNNLVLWLGATLDEPGATIDLHPQTLRAVLGTVTAEAAAWVLTEAHDAGLLRGMRSKEMTSTPPIYRATLSPQGWVALQQLQTQNSDSRRAFMAMQFGDAELTSVFENCFRSAVKRTGFDLTKLDDEPRAGLIDDRLRLEIRRSRFVIADLTHGNPGAYWEGGYAEGLGRPVIYTCKASVFEHEDRRRRPHFDANHHLIIPWDPKNLAKAASDLATTIRVTLPAEARLDDQ